MAQDKDTVKAGWYVALLVDVLGQHEAIRNAPPLPRTEEDRVSYLGAMRESAGKAEQVRKLVSAFFGRYLDVTSPAILNKLNTEQRAQYDILSECPIHIQMFSDTVIAFAPLCTSGRVSTRGVIAMIWAAVSTLVHSLSDEIAVRGAIDVDEAIELHENELYGRVVLNVHHLEKNVAQWPRIVVGKGLLEFLTQMQKMPCSDVVDQMNSKVAQKCLSIIEPDVDGVPIIDYLGRGVRCEFGSSALAQETLERSFAFVRREHKRFAQSGDRKLALRYGLLRHYYERKTAE